MHKRTIATVLLLALALTLAAPVAFAEEGYGRGIPADLKAVIDAGSDPAAMAKGFGAHAETVTGDKNFVENAGAAMQAQSALALKPSDPAADQAALLDSYTAHLYSLLLKWHESRGWDDEWFQRSGMMTEDGDWYSFESYENALRLLQWGFALNHQNHGTPYEESYQDIIKQLKYVINNPGKGPMPRD